MIEIIGEPHRPNRLNLVVHKGRRAITSDCRIAGCQQASSLHCWLSERQGISPSMATSLHSSLHKKQRRLCCMAQRFQCASVPSSCGTVIKYRGANGTHKIHSGSVEGVNLENLALDTIHAFVWNLTTCLALPMQIIAWSVVIWSYTKEFKKVHDIAQHSISAFENMQVVHGVVCKCRTL